MIDLYTEKTLLLIPRVLFEHVFGDETAQIEQELKAGDLQSLRSFPFVTGSFEDINGRIGLTLLKQAGIDRPVIKAFSHNVGMLLKLCVQCVGACFCPDYLVESVLNEEEFANLMVFQLPDKAQYNIKAVSNSSLVPVLSVWQFFSLIIRRSSHINCSICFFYSVHVINKPDIIFNTPILYHRGSFLICHPRAFRHQNKII